MNIAIVGAGLVGRVLALNLLREGHTLTLFDKDTKEGVNSAGFTAAGMLAPFAELETAESIIFELGNRSMELWKALLRDAGVYDGLQRKGTIITAHPQDMPELEHFIKTLRNKIDKAKEIKLLNSQELSTIEPELAHHTQSFFLKDEGQVDSQRFIAFSTNYLDSMPNISWREYTFVDKIESGRVYVNGKIEEFDWVFDSRGLGAKEHFKDLRGVRGEVIWVEAKDVDIIRPTRLMHPRYKIYIVPRANGCEGIDLEYCKDCKIAQTVAGAKRYIVGASEIESEDRSDISVRSTLELLSALFTVHPNFGEARVVNTETNCRPAFRDNLPRIEQEERLTRINGLYRHGYLLAPAIVEKALNEGIRRVNE
jgi:glycine oxidase